MKKQIILIMTDTTRKDMLGCYGNPQMVTPNLDKLAEEGIKYENTYTCQPVCGPARSAIFTGTFPHTNGVVTNCIAMGDNVKTIGQRLTDNKIHCGYVGKWHLDGGDYFGLGKCPEGWDEEYWYDMKCYLNELTDEEKVKSRQSSTSYEPGLTEDFTYAHRCSNRAIDFLNRYKDEDFFLTVSYDEPHGPCICPAPYNTMYEGFKFDDNPNFQDDLSKKPFMQQLWSGDDINKPIEMLNKPSKQLALFLGCNTFVDHEIGRIINVINEQIPNALVIFTSDHGDMLGAHRLQMKNAVAYKEIANIPLIIRGGEKGKTINYPASHIDIAPTILEYIGVPVPKILEGKSMLAQIKDTSVKINDVVFTEFTRYEVDHDGFGGLQIMRAAITEQYKLVINLLDSDEFYNMEKDPYEVCNLINSDEYADIRNELHDKLLQNMNNTRDLYRGYQWACRTWRKDKKPTWENDGYTRQRENEEYEPRQLDYDTGFPMKNAVRLKTTNDKKN
ncbi:sulfatase-like hydrolase/transferase [Candidatus Clostridium helianthi]|uniref:Sulfatase-like hydrolase/transferase n=1 Tax=Candidatus Clostridium helianthi TaxID=3381660 RepID=A0ABW8RZQ0_9CLOT